MASIWPASEISVARTRGSLLRVNQAVKSGLFTPKDAHDPEGRDSEGKIAAKGKDQQAKHAQQVQGEQHANRRALVIQIALPARKFGRTNHQQVSQDGDKTEPDDWRERPQWGKSKIRLQVWLAQAIEAFAGKTIEKTHTQDQQQHGTGPGSAKAGLEGRGKAAPGLTLLFWRWRKAMFRHNQRQEQAQQNNQAASHNNRQIEPDARQRHAAERAEN